MTPVAASGVVGYVRPFVFGVFIAVLVVARNYSWWAVVAAGVVLVLATPRLNSRVAAGVLTFALLLGPSY